MLSQSVEIPNIIKYSMAQKGVSPQGTKVEVVDFQTINGAVYSNQNNIIQIDMASDTGFLDTNRAELLMDLTVNLTNGSTVYLDGSAYAMFQRLRVLDGSSNELANIDNYGDFVNNTIYHQMSKSQQSACAERWGLMSYKGDYDTTYALNAGVLTPTLTHSAFDTVYSPVSNYFTGPSATHRYSLPMLGVGILNVSSANNANPVYLPLALTKSLRLELTLKNNINDMFIAYSDVSISSISVSNVRYRCRVVHFASQILDAMKMALMDQSLGPLSGKLAISGYSYFMDNRSVSTGNLALNVGSRAKSIKSLLVIPRPQANRGDLRRSKWSSISLAPTSFQIKIGSNYFPQTPLNSDLECYAELENALGKCGGLTNFANFSNSTVQDFVRGENLPNATYGLDLESLPREFIENGIDNSTNSLPLFVNINTSNSTAIDCQLAILADVNFVFDINTKTIRREY